ncbi:hatching enzyme 1.2-like [Hydractinia symbiolongicarpus]|uniref:hatching enzyme 1.2-like n=1 Tax=Hydractinia symbiolongicarpus TaxID=13093 RepID=UPI002550F70A|nr:hatching enzyme 1.2-like [Hydractinia symbiolongicarpus]
MKFHFAFLFVCFTALQARIILNPNYFEGDIILSPEERRNIYKPNNKFGASKKKWPSKTIVYEFAADIEKEIGAKQAIYAAINEYHRHTCLKFVRRTTQSTYMEFYNGQGCGAPLGYRSGRSKISLQGPACWKKGSVMHEIMHSLGFYHEQSRPDRDNYVKILWDNITPKDMKSNFQKQPYSNVDSMNSPYDYLSIMHYHKDGFAKRGTLTIETLDKRFQDKIGQRDGFSPSDIKQINKLYKCGKNFVTQPPLRTQVPVCKDKNPNCGFYLRFCKDPSWRDSMKKDCKFTCSFCDSS